MTAQQHIELGRAARNEGRLEEAVQHYRNAASLLHSEPLRYAHTIRHVGDILRKAGHLAEAEPCFLEAIAIYRAHPERNTLDMGNALRGYACLADLQGDTALSIALWTETRELYIAVGIDAGIEESTQRLAQAQQK